MGSDQIIFNLKEAKTIVKERFVDDDMDKFFEIYHSTDGQNSSLDENIEDQDIIHYPFTQSLLIVKLALLNSSLSTSLTAPADLSTAT